MLLTAATSAAADIITAPDNQPLPQSHSLTYAPALPTATATAHIAAATSTAASILWWLPCLILQPAPLIRVDPRPLGPIALCGACLGLTSIDCIHWPLEFVLCGSEVLQIQKQHVAVSYILMLMRAAQGQGRHHGIICPLLTAGACMQVSVVYFVVSTVQRVLSLSTGELDAPWWHTASAAAADSCTWHTLLTALHEHEGGNAAGLGRTC